MDNICLTKLTFFVPGVLLKANVAEVQDSSDDSEDVCLLLSHQTDFVHGLLKDFELFGIVYCRIKEGGGVKVLHGVEFG